MKPRILCIVGKSGCGKSTCANHIENMFDIPMIQSWTDRPKRAPDETGHIFLSKEDFAKFKHEDMIAYTNFGNYSYCCLHSDVKPINTYVIDERGLKYLKANFSDRYDIKSVFIHRPEELRIAQVGKERVDRDKGMYNLPAEAFDYHIWNHVSLDEFKGNINLMVYEWNLTAQS